ncbi:MAG: citronellol/citronellal dehydrogenase [Chloroflexi bacterium]|jgi:NAD(P)-dependent dehydrogenase (short-subunit alcohol dehydrogenase family)|nr:MAG: citronellol/citronellal dehydrogenase [Chloroflexota bacterium]
MGTLDGRVALVTGSSRGIGEYMALHFARAGAKVAIAARTTEVTDKRLPGTIYSVAESINKDGGEAIGVQMNMRDPESITAGVDETVDKLGGLDIVVNNAAILVPGSLETVQDRHIDLIWQIDLRGPLILMKRALPHLKSAGAGDFINVSSVAGVFPGPGPYEGTPSGRDGSFYGMIKAGLERFSQGLAKELQGDKIKVNVLSPQGRIKTPGNIWAENDPENPSLEFEAADEMGKAGVWICEQPNTYTGHILFDQDVCKEQNL